MEVQRVLCKNGHLLGLIYDRKLHIKHMGRKIEIAIPLVEPLDAVFVCDRCGEPQKVELLRKTLLTWDSENKCCKNSESVIYVNHNGI